MRTCINIHFYSPELLGVANTVYVVAYILLPYIVPLTVDIFGENSFGSTSELSVPFDTEASVSRGNSLIRLCQVVPQ